MGNKEQHNDLIKTKIRNVCSECLMPSYQVWVEVGDVMSKEVITISPDVTATSAAKMMSDNNISCIIVTDNENVAGILTEKDFLKRAVAEGKDFDKIKVKEIMSSPVESISPDLSVFEASKIMKAKHIKRLPILEEGRLVGIVTQTDLVRILTAYGIWSDVAEIMVRDVAGIQSKATVAEAMEVMTSRNISCIVVLKADEAVGILTERDLLKRVVALQKNPTDVKTEEAMSSPVISVPPGCSVFSTSRIMEKMSIRRLVVMEDKRLCGIVTQTDIFRSAKKKLQEEEEKNFGLLEKSESGIYTIDLDGKTIYVNPAFMKLFGVSDPREFIGRPFLPKRFWFNPEERPQILRQLKKGSVEIKELALKNSKGKRIYVTLFSTFTKNIHGEINGNQGMLYDITAKKELVALREAEEALRESEQKFRSLVETSSDWIWEVDRNGVYTYASPKVKDLLGYEPEEIISRTPFDLMPPDEAERVAKLFKDAVESLRAFTGLVNTNLHKDGQEVVLETNGVPILDQTGNLLGYRGVDRDITKRRRAEEALKESELKFKTIFENAGGAIFIADTKTGEILDCNSQAEKLIGRSRQEIIGIHQSKLHPEGEEEKYKEKFAAHAQEGHIVDFEGEVQHSNGKRIPIWIAAQTMKIGDKDVIVGLFMDVTERKQAEEKLREAKEQADQLAQDAVVADLAKSQFLANMSHEIRTPMNAIIGFSQILSGEELTDEQKRHIDIIRESAEHLLQLLNDILDISKIEAGKLDTKIIDCSLEQLLAVVESLMRSQARVKELRFEILQCSELPGQIRTDAVRLRQCLVNLIDNAIKFTEKGHVYVNVSLQEVNNKPYICFDVEDTGIGIRPDKQELIFEEFTQVNGSSTRKYRGTGLGLSITKKLAHLLGGELSLTSELGKGSVFSLRIPAGVDVESRPLFDKYKLVTESNQVVKTSDIAGQDKLCGRVLVAEDTRSNQLLIKLLLERSGLEVTIAEDGKEVVQKALSEPFNLIFMDMQMPNMNGYEATRVLRRKGLKTAIVALTAYAMKGDEEKCIAAGCNDYLAKPIDSEELLKIICKHLLSENVALSKRTNSVGSQVD